MLASLIKYGKHPGTVPEGRQALDPTPSGLRLHLKLSFPVPVIQDHKGPCRNGSLTSQRQLASSHSVTELSAGPLPLLGAKQSPWLSLCVFLHTPGPVTGNAVSIGQGPWQGSPRQFSSPTFSREPERLLLQLSPAGLGEGGSESSSQRLSNLWSTQILWKGKERRHN